MLPQFWRKLSCSPETWWSYEDLRGVKSSSTLNDSWAWYVFFFYSFFFIYLTQYSSLSFFFFFLKAVQSTFKLEEMTNSLSQQLDDERKRRVAAVQTLTIVKNSNADLRKKLTAEEQARKSADAVLKGAGRQAESQRKLTNEANEQLAASKEQLAALRKQLEEAKRLRDHAEKARVQAEEDKAKVEKERDEAEQHSYDVGVTETEDALRVEVPAVCCAYCTQTWEEALNRAGIDASSELRKPENIIFSHALQIPNQKEATPQVSQPAEEAQPQHPPSSSQQE